MSANTVRAHHPHFFRDAGNFSFWRLVPRITPFRASLGPDHQGSSARRPAEAPGMVTVLTIDGRTGAFPPVEEDRRAWPDIPRSCPCASARFSRHFSFFLGRWATPVRAPVLGIVYGDHCDHIPAAPAPLARGRNGDASSEKSGNLRLSNMQYEQLAGRPSVPRSLPRPSNPTPAWGSSASPRCCKARTTNYYLRHRPVRQRLIKRSGEPPPPPCVDPRQPAEGLAPVNRPITCAPSIVPHSPTVCCVEQPRAAATCSAPQSCGGAPRRHAEACSVGQ